MPAGIRIQVPVSSRSNPAIRDILSETGFKLFVIYWRAGGGDYASQIPAAFADAIKFLRIVAPIGDLTVSMLTTDESEEVVAIALTLQCSVERICE